MFCILQSALNDQLIEAAKKGNCDEIRRLVGNGADKNCKDDVREKSKFCLFCIFDLSLFASCVCSFVLILFLFLWIKIISLCSYRVVILH